MTVQNNPVIFSNIPGKDYLELYPRNETQYSKVIDILSFKKGDISKATGVPISSIRYDAKIPHEIQKRIREWAILLNLVAEHFEGDNHKTIMWFTTRNPLLGDMSPRDMIRLGRYDKLFKFVVNAISENKRQ